MGFIYKNHNAQNSVMVYLGYVFVLKLAYFKGIQKFYGLYCKINSWLLFAFPALKITL
jgi:hypothetical protein